MYLFQDKDTGKNRTACFHPLTGIYMYLLNEFERILEEYTFSSPDGDLYVFIPTLKISLYYWAKNRVCGGKAVQQVLQKIYSVKLCINPLYKPIGAKCYFIAIVHTPIVYFLF